MKFNDRTARANKHTAKTEARFEKKPAATIVVKPRPEGDLQDILSEQPQGLYLVLDCVQDPHNLGAILRTADGAGVAAVIAPKDKSVGITETVLRVSVGAAENVPFVQVTNLARTMKQMKDAGIWFVGTSDHGDRSLYDIDFRGGIALVMSGRRWHAPADRGELRFPGTHSHGGQSAVPECFRGHGRVPLRSCAAARPLILSHELHHRH